MIILGGIVCRVSDLERDSAIEAGVSSRAIEETEGALGVEALELALMTG